MKKIPVLFTLLILTVLSHCETRTTLSAVNFRSSPEMGDNVICIIPKGTELSFIEGMFFFRGWIPVEYNGRIGYVYKTFLEQKVIYDNKCRLYYSLN